jgi:CDP-glucose 4,6-dehydratase
MNRNFWANKRVFITGHSGFKGSWLSLWLLKLGAKVKGYSLPPNTEPNICSLFNLSSHMTSEFGDINDYEKLFKSIDSFKPEIIFHMAAQPLVRYSYKNPLETYKTNVIGTANLLESVRCINNIRAVVNITTDKCYENNDDNIAYAENDRMGGNDPYSSSKACSELVTNAFRKSYFPTNNYNNHGVALASVRAGNVIGGGDWSEDRIIPDIIKSIENDFTLNIRNPHATRPWQHVLEPLGGYMSLAEKLYLDGSNFSEAWNFGPNEDCSISVIDLVKKLDSLWNKNIHWKIDENNHPKESHYLRLDISKSEKRLSWEPLLDLETTLRLIIDWSDAFISKNDMENFSISQIKSYESLMH